ncbi:hypothetical protein HYX06_00380 [Candidatus Woesearchaeota archaeon]|nr:hypothetical protein [Candidatus Woesearchaeota archaeon]
MKVENIYGNFRNINNSDNFTERIKNSYDISKKFLVEEYILRKKSQDQIAKSLGVSQWVISQRLRKYKIPIRDKTYKLDARKYEVNMNFFDDINQNNAWVLGWILSDGFINKTKNSHSFGLKLSRKDIEVLTKIKNLLGYTGKIFINKDFLKRTNKYYEQSLLKISSKYLVRRLENLGVTESKTKKELFPEIIKVSDNEEIVRSFIKGFFEGDGSIIYKKNSLLFQIVGTKEILLDIQYFLIKYLNLNMVKLTQNIKNENHWALRYRGNRQALRIFDWLYRDSILHLDRKYKKYLDIKEILEK